MKSFAALNTASKPEQSTRKAETESERTTGIVFDVQRFSVHDGPGIRTLVFLKGCTLRCRWCSNPESQRAAPDLLYSQTRCLRCSQCVRVCPEGALNLGESAILINRAKCNLCGQCAAVCPARAMRIAGRRMSVEEVLVEVERDRTFYEHSGGGMTLSGGEPLAQPDFALALLRGARARRIHTAVETAGWADPADVLRVLSETDLILYDVKHMDSRKHMAGTGVPNERILRNAELASKLGVMMVVRTPVIPGFNNEPNDILTIGRFALALGLTEMHLLPYHKYGVSKYASLGREYELADLATPAKKDMELLRQKLESLGLQVRIGG